MAIVVRNPTLLRKLLWLDTALGSSTALIGLILSTRVAALFGLSTKLVIIIAAITALYAVVALILAVKKPLTITAVRGLVVANWLWTGVSVALLLARPSEATALGIAFLVTQVIAVGGLAWLEGAQLQKLPR